MIGFALLAAGHTPQGHANGPLPAPGPLTRALLLWHFRLSPPVSRCIGFFNLLWHRRMVPHSSPFPYGDVVARILDTVPRRNSTDLLFPSHVSEERPFSGWSKYKRDLTDGVKGWQLHDLRRTF